MSKFKCPCGNVISDVLYPCETRGKILRQADDERYYGAVVERIRDFCAAVASDQRSAWIRGSLGKDYPKELDDADVISDLIAACDLSYSILIDECEQCGRLHLQNKPGSPGLVSFAPDVGKYTGVLRSTTDWEKS